MALFYATLPPGSSQQFTTRQRIETEGIPRHPQIAVGPRAAVVIVWDEQEKGSRRAVIGRGNPTGAGALRFSRQAVGGEETGTYPVVAATEQGVVVAWTSGAAGATVIRAERVQE